MTHHHLFTLLLYSSAAQDYFNKLCKIRTDTPGVVIASVKKEDVLCFHTDRSWQGERLTTSIGFG